MIVILQLTLCFREKKIIMMNHPNSLWPFFFWFDKFVWWGKKTHSSIQAQLFLLLISSHLLYKWPCFFLSANNNSACCRALRGRSPSGFQFFADIKAASILWRQRKVILETWHLDISRFSWFDRCSFYTFMFVNVSAWDGSRPPPSLDEIEVDGRFVLPTMKNSAMTW